MNGTLNVTLRFVKDENGSVIYGFRASAMRRFAHKLWAGLNSIGKAPKTWGKVNATVATQYQNEMEQKIFELHLCDNHWKADLIATLNYPSWYNNNIEKEEHLKCASVDPPPDTKRLRASADAPVTPSVHLPPHKKCSKSARVPAKDIDSQLPEVRIPLMQYIDFICNLYRISYRMKVSRHLELIVAPLYNMIHQQAPEILKLVQGPK